MNHIVDLALNCYYKQFTIEHWTTNTADTKEIGYCIQRRRKKNVQEFRQEKC